MGPGKLPWIIEAKRYQAHVAGCLEKGTYPQLLAHYKQNDKMLPKRVLGVDTHMPAVQVCTKVAEAMLPFLDKEADPFWATVAVFMFGIDDQPQTATMKTPDIWKTADDLKKIATGSRLEDPIKRQLQAAYCLCGPELTDAVQIIQFARSKLQQACDSLRDGLQNEVKQTALQIIKAVLQGDSAALQNLSPAAPIPVAPAPKGVLQQQQGTQSRSDRRATGAQQQPKSIRVNSRTSAKMLLDYERCMDCMVLEVVRTGSGEYKRLKKGSTMKSWFQNCSADLEAMLCSEAASKLGLVLKLQCLVADKTLLFCQNESKVMYLINRLTGLRHPCAATIAGSATKFSVIGSGSSGVVLLTPASECEAPKAVKYLLLNIEGNQETKSTQPDDSVLARILRCQKVDARHAIAELMAMVVANRYCPRVTLTPLGWSFETIKGAGCTARCLSISMPYAGMNWNDVKKKLLTLAQDAGMNDKDQLLLLRYAVTCMGRSAAACVADLHSNGLLHRDIKPENLLQLGTLEAGDCRSIIQAIEEPHKCRLIDLGAMVAALPAGGSLQYKHIPLTGGTEVMQSPEVLNCIDSTGSLDSGTLRKVDVYSLGVTMMRLAYLHPRSGGYPLEGRCNILMHCDQRQGVLAHTGFALRDNMLRLLKISDPDLPREVLAFIRRSTANQIKQRPETAALLKYAHGVMDEQAAILKAEVHALLEAKS